MQLFRHKPSQLDSTLNFSEKNMEQILARQQKELDAVEQQYYKEFPNAHKQKIIQKKLREAQKKRQRSDLEEDEMQEMLGTKKTPKVSSSCQTINLASHKQVGQLREEAEQQEELRKS